MIRQIGDWLMELPNEVVPEALLNTNSSALNATARNLHLALWYAFYWQDTAEGFEFWAKVFMRVYKPNTPT